MNIFEFFDGSTDENLLKYKLPTTFVEKTADENLQNYPKFSILLCPNSGSIGLMLRSYTCGIVFLFDGKMNFMVPQNFYMYVSKLAFCFFIENPIRTPNDRFIVYF